LQQEKIKLIMMEQTIVPDINASRFFNSSLGDQSRPNLRRSFNMSPSTNLNYASMMTTLKTTGGIAGEMSPSDNNKMNSTELKG